MPLASIVPPWWQYVFILAWKPDGGLTMALFGGHIDMNDFAIAAEHALHQSYYLGSASKSFHMHFDSYDSVLKTMGIKCVGSCFNCGRLGEKIRKCEGCHFARYCGRKCQRQHWKSGHRSSCSTIGFDHRRQRRAEDLAVWGIISGYDFDLWKRIASNHRVMNLGEGDTMFSRTDGASVALL